MFLQVCICFAFECGGLWFAFNNFLFFLSLTSSFIHNTFSLLLLGLQSSCIILTLTIDSSLHTHSPFIPVCSLQFFTSRLGNYLSCGIEKKTQLDNVKVSQEWDRGSTKEALSLARRVHVTRSILPNLGNNTEARIHWPHSRLLFSVALFWRFTKPDKGHQIQERPQS